ncbi:foldase protein PrsA [Pullulanibacillus pueri]|uniref:Foldase protein PrsA n=1 Tax=Pullulanibacillus pueri TaxID=1437324 RepID=A0A8J3A0N4_9BACL|nr:peptidylprolyl isomerase [Pullulanibacillus pueri]MBM7683425.1 foldase protein PrsA [Pullulanibacillus pueri]GGH88089.1 foldase protein PrsA [Pullulanibacillus pueri]
MKKWMTIVVVIIGILTLSACGNSSVVETKAGDISKDDFYKELQKEAGSASLQKLVYEKILSDKYKATDKEINDEIDNEIEQLKSQYQMTSDAQLEQALAAQGQTMDDFRKSFKDDAKLQVLLFKAQTDGIKVTDKDLQDYFNKNKDTFVQVKASHILVDSEKKANDIEKKIKNGEDFAKLAKDNSTDPGSKDNGGDLGWFGKGTMYQAFEDKAFSMKVGDISEPVKTDAGWHIIKLTGKKDKLSDVKAAVKKAYLTSKEKDAQTVLNKLLKDNDIKVNLKDDQYKGLFDPQETTTTPSTSTDDSSSQSDDSSKSSDDSSKSSDDSSKDSSKSDK